MIRQHFFTNRIVNLWNSLPSSIVTAPTVASFKQQLDDFWKQSRYGHFQMPACGLALADCLARASPAHLIIITTKYVKIIINVIENYVINNNE